MKLVLCSPKGDKNWILFVKELAGDEKFEAHRSNFCDCENSQRWEADRIIREESTAIGVRNIFNQCRWVGITGWEFWIDDQSKILEIAMNVGEKLGLELAIE